MENTYKHGFKQNSSYGSKSFRYSEDHMEYIDEGCQSDERDFSLSRLPPCFFLNDKSLIEKINDNELQEGTRDVIFSTSKIRNESGLNSHSISDSVFLGDILDADLSDIEGEDDGTFFNKLDLFNLNNSSFILPPSREHSHSLPHQRISTPRKRKYSSSSCEVERRLYALLHTDADEDEDIEENYLDTVWSSSNQTLYPQCGMFFKGVENPSSPICPHDNYQIIEELPIISVKGTSLPPTVTNKALLNHTPTNHPPSNHTPTKHTPTNNKTLTNLTPTIPTSTNHTPTNHTSTQHTTTNHTSTNHTSDFFTSLKNPELTYQGDSYNNEVLIGIDHDFNNNLQQHNNLQHQQQHNLQQQHTNLQQQHNNLQQQQQHNRQQHTNIQQQQYNQQHQQAIPSAPQTTYNSYTNLLLSQFEGKESYRDKLLEGMEKVQTRSVKLHNPTHNNHTATHNNHTATHNNYNPTHNNYNQTHNNYNQTHNNHNLTHDNHVYSNSIKPESNINHTSNQNTKYDKKGGLYVDCEEVSFKKTLSKQQINLDQHIYSEIGSSVDVKDKMEGNGMIEKGRVGRHGWDESGDDGVRDKNLQNGGVKERLKNHKLAGNTLEKKKIRFQDDGLVSKDLTFMTSNKDKIQNDGKKEQNNKHSKKPSKQASDKTTIVPQTNLKYLNTNNTQYTHLKDKIKTTNKSNMADKGYLLSSDEGVITSPMLSPQENKTHNTQHRVKKQKKNKKMKYDATDGDSVDGLHKKSDEKDWQRPSRNFDEILWRPAISMGIIIITGIIIFYFKDRLPLMLSSKFPYHKSSI